MPSPRRFRALRQLKFTVVFAGWVKVKNPKAPAVKREAEEDWGNNRWNHARRRAVNFAKPEVQTSERQ